MVVVMSLFPVHDTHRVQTPMERLVTDMASLTAMLGLTGPYSDGVPCVGESALALGDARVMLLRLYFVSVLWMTMRLAGLYKINSNCIMWTVVITLLCWCSKGFV